jgi:hypothetical protein
MNREKGLLLKIADVGFYMKWTHPPLSKPTDYRYNGFIYNDKIKQAIRGLKQVTAIHVHCAKPEKEILLTRSLRKILTIPKRWALYKDRTHYIMKIFHSRQNRLMSIARIGVDFKNIDYYFLEPDYKGLYIDRHDTRDYWLLPRLAHPLIKTLLINFLAKQGGCLIHGTGVKVRNLGLGFVGKSGSGKSTLAGFFRIYKDTTVLTDENLAVSRKGNRFYVYGTPWPGGVRITNAASAPLKYIFFIRHGKANAIRPVSAGEAFKKLISQAILCAWEESLISSTVNFIRDLSRGIEFFDLEFVNDKRVIPFLIEKLML